MSLAKYSWQIILRRGASSRAATSIAQRQRCNRNCLVIQQTIQTAWNSSKTPNNTIDNENTDDTSEWIPPSHPLAGDRGQSHLDQRFHEPNLAEIEKQLKELEMEEKTSRTSTNDVDWLQTRRKKMGPIDMLLPHEAKLKKDALAEIPIKHHTLLSKDEIATCLEAMGGRDITVILDDPRNRRMGGALGLILVSASTHTQLSMMADALVRQMRRRDLHQLDVLGAKYGPEGNQRSSSQAEETWIVVDCRNYVVHFQDEVTRKLIDLEALWSGKDPLFEIDYRDEDQVDDYVASHPVPMHYGRSTVEFDNVLKQLHKRRYTSPHKPVVRKTKKKLSSRRR
jgi:ribosomal silencing factor RsfS